MTDYELLKDTYKYAIKYSTDPSTQNGALIVPNGRNERIFGANHFPTNVLESSERWERPLKYAYVEHAERNAIYSAAKYGTPTWEATMYAAWASCTDCARAIIQSGITRLVTHDTPAHNNPNAKWKESIEIAMNMLEEAGIKIEYIKEPMDLEILFDGMLVKV